MSRFRFTPEQQRYLDTLTPHGRGVVEFRHFALGELDRVEAANPELPRGKIVEIVVESLRRRFPGRARSPGRILEWEKYYKRDGLAGLRDGRGRPLTGERYYRANPLAVSSVDLADVLARLRDHICAGFDAEIDALRARRPRRRGKP